MVKILYKKSYRLSSLKLIKYDSLWGKKGIFSTIRVCGKKPKLILINSHIKNMNLALAKMNINFVISKKIIFELLKSVLCKINNQDNLLRIAINSSTISLSLRSRLKYHKRFSGKIVYYQRPIPNLKNLYYKKTMKLINSINPHKQEIILCNKGLLLEGCTTNILCVKDKKIYVPIKNYYKGTTLNHLLSVAERSIRKVNISIDSLKKYDEILLIGSGKGVVSLSKIPQINWNSRSDIVYKEFLKLYKKIL